MSPVLEGGFLTTGLPGKSLSVLVNKAFRTEPQPFLLLILLILLCMYLLSFLPSWNFYSSCGWLIISSAIINNEAS